MYLVQLCKYYALEITEIYYENSHEKWAKLKNI